MATRRGPDNSVRFSIGGTQNGVAWANVFWAMLTMSGTPTQAQLDAWLTSVSTAYKTRFSPALLTIVTYTQAQAILFLPGSQSLPSLVSMTGAGTGGTSAGESQDNCSVLSWQIAAYWRGGKPRTYLPTPSGAFLQNNKELTPTAITTLVSEAQGFISDVAGVSSGPISAGQLGTVSFKHGGADRVPPVFFPYLGVKVHPRLGTQRARLGKWRP